MGTCNCLKKSKEFGAFHHLVRELDLCKHREYFRMPLSNMEDILNTIGHLTEKQHAIREPIEAEKRRAICIR